MRDPSPMFPSTPQMAFGSSRAVDMLSARVLSCQSRSIRLPVCNPSPRQSYSTYSGVDNDIDLVYRRHGHNNPLPPPFHRLRLLRPSRQRNVRPLPRRLHTPLLHETPRFPSRRRRKLHSCCSRAVYPLCACEQV